VAQVSLENNLNNGIEVVLKITIVRIMLAVHALDVDHLHLTASSNHQNNVLLNPQHSPEPNLSTNPSIMSRWSQYDEDDYRLPEGMRRVGYDADTQVYTYQDEDGQYWEGEPGNRYGEMHRISDPSPTYHPPQPAFATRDNSWRYLAPFFLLVCLFLLLVYTVVGGGLPFSGGKGLVRVERTCAVGQDKYVVRKGDTCWDISKRYQMSVQQLESMNGEADCEKLTPGMKLCVKGVRKEVPEAEGRRVGDDLTGGNRDRTQAKGNGKGSRS